MKLENPWLEDHWADVRATLITYLRDALAERLPADLVAESKEHIAIAGGTEGKDSALRADVAVKAEAWRAGIPPQWSPEDDSELAKRAAVPLIVPAHPPTERWIEIHDFAGRLITVIEILSPSNKTGPGHYRYLKKQETYLGAELNLVEIDLLRGGRLTVASRLEPVAALRDTHYWICMRRELSPDVFEIYRPKLLEPLPVIGIPLRSQDRDVFVDLQPLIDRVYKTGRYWRLDYGSPPTPPLSNEDMAWAQSLLTV